MRPQEAIVMAKVREAVIIGGFLLPSLILDYLLTQVREVVIMGGVEPFTPGVAPPGVKASTSRL